MGFVSHNMAGIPGGPPILGEPMDVWERYEKIREDRYEDLLRTLARQPTELRDLTDAEILKVLEALRKCRELPAEFN